MHDYDQNPQSQAKAGRTKSKRTGKAAAVGEGEKNCAAS
jgi:hypothetical protein